MRITKKKIAAVVAATTVVALGAGSAYAFFTNPSANGAGGGTVGHSGTWDFAFVNSSGDAALYPNMGTQTFNYTVTNNGDAPAYLSSITAATANDGGSPALALSFPSGTAIAGCTANSFTPTAGGYSAQTVAAHASVSFSVTLVMNETNQNQDGCQNSTPEFTFTAA